MRLDSHGSVAILAARDIETPRVYARCDRYVAARGWRRASVPATGRIAEAFRA